MPMYFDATFSWSGYSYQGKVGMFIVLKHLNSYAGNNLEAHFNNWSLEFEWLEDFSIKNGNTYLSLHQVKTLNSTNINSYNEAIQQTVNNSTVLGYQITPYFHVSSNVQNPHNIFYTYTINGANQRYCPLEQINGLIKDEIKLFLEIYNRADYDGSSEEVHFLKLLSIIDEHVRQRHSNIQNIPAPRHIETISFDEIINSLKTDSLQFSNERLICEKKAYFEKIVDEFLQDKNQVMQDKLKKFVRKAFDLNDDFVKFSKSTIPHISSIFNNEMSITDFQNLLHQDLLKGALLKTIVLVDKGYDCVGHKFIYKKNHKKFLPTAIIRSQDDCKEICTNIAKSPFAVEDLFEMDFFITERINCDSIENEADNFNEIRDEDLQNAENKENNINRLKKVGLIDLDNAKRIIDA